MGKIKRAAVPKRRSEAKPKPKNSEPIPSTSKQTPMPIARTPRSTLGKRAAAVSKDRTLDTNNNNDNVYSKRRRVPHKPFQAEEPLPSKLLKMLANLPDVQSGFKNTKSTTAKIEPKKSIKKAAPVALVKSPVITKKKSATIVPLDLPTLNKKGANPKPKKKSSITSPTLTIQDPTVSSKTSTKKVSITKARLSAGVVSTKKKLATLTKAKPVDKAKQSLLTPKGANKPPFSTSTFIPRTSSAKLPKIQINSIASTSKGIVKIKKNQNKGTTKKMLSNETGAQPLIKIIKQTIKRKSTLIDKPPILPIPVPYINFLDTFSSTLLQAPKPPTPSKLITIVNSPNKVRKSKLPTWVPRPHVTNYIVDPTFESTLPLPFISTLAHSKLLIRAVLAGNNAELESLMKQTNLVATFAAQRSLNNPNDAFYYAIQTKNLGAMELLLNAKLAEKLAPFPDIIIESESTGKSSIYMLGHAMRNVSVSRGAKEGNDALIKDKHQYQAGSRVRSGHNFDAIDFCFQQGYSWETIKLIKTLYGDSDSTQLQFIHHLYGALWRGHHKLAGDLVTEAINRGGHGFNQLHKEALTLSNGTPFTQFKSISITKKATGSNRVTPVHLAAINPNPYYLKTLLTIRPEYSVMDTIGRSPIHFASVCTGPGPIKYLLAQGISVFVADKEGKTPLYLAAEMGRVENVRLIVQSQQLVENQEFAATDFNKDPFINRANLKNGYSPLHIAVKNGHFDVVNELLDLGANAEKILPAQFDKLTPAMIAAQVGNLNILRLLIEKGDINIDVVDKMGKTALTHAVIDGQGHIVSYLLRLGANNNVKDSSGNSLPHYAAAYGWYFIWNLLMESGCPPNEPNDWKMTPLGIAFLKGHIGLVELIMSQPGIDVNSPIDDTTGQNLLLQTCNSALSDSFIGRLTFLIQNQNVDCSARDLKQNNALHYLVATEACEIDKRLDCYEWMKQEQSKSPRHKKFGKDKLTIPDMSPDSFSTMHSVDELLKNRKYIHEAVKLLLSRDCRPSSINAEMVSPASLAFKLGCIELIELFVENRYSVQDLALQINKTGDTILHSIIQYLCSRDHKTSRRIQIQEFMCTLAKEPSVLKQFQDMSKMKNSTGFTPLNHLLKHFADDNIIKPGSNSTKSNNYYIECLSFLLNELDSDVNDVVGDGSNNTPLHLAVSREKLSVESMTQIMSKNPALNPLNKELKTPLIMAILKQNEAGAICLIESGANVNFISISDGNKSVLMLAAEHFGSTFNIIPALVANKVELDTFDSKTGNSVFHLLAMKPNVPSVIDTVEKLIKSGCDVAKANARGQLPLHLVVNERGGETDVSYQLEELFINSSPKTLLATDSQGRIPLHYVFVKQSNVDGLDVPAKKIDPIELVALITRSMKQLTNSPESIFLADNFKSTPLHYAAICGSIISISLLISELKLSSSFPGIDAQDVDGNTPFGLAVWKGNDGAALQFQQHGADFLSALNTYPSSKFEASTFEWSVRSQILDEKQREAKIKSRYSILQEVVNKDQQGMLHLMLEKLSESSAGIIKAVEAALRTKRFKLALKLLKRTKDLTDSPKSENSSTLFHIMAKTEPGNNAIEQIQIVQALLDKNAAIKDVDVFGSNALIYAAINWNIQLCLEFTRTLKIDEVASMRSDNFDRTPLSALFWKLIKKSNQPFPEELKKWGESLIDAGSSPNVLVKYPIVRSNYPRIGYLVVDDGIVKNEPNSSATTPLILAVLSRNYDVVKWLLGTGKVGFAKNVNVDFQDGLGRTALMYAVKLNDIKMVKLLLNHRTYNVEKDKRPWSNNNKKNNTFNPTRTPNLEIQDINGWTVLHHLISPIQLFASASQNNICFVNGIKVLRILTNSIGLATSALLIKTNDNQTVLELAKATCNYQPIIDHLEQLLRIQTLQRTKVVENYDFIKIQNEDNIITQSNGILDNPTTEADLNLDSQEIVKSLKDEMVIDENTETKYQLKPDPLIGMKKVSTVLLQDSTQANIPFDCLLTQVDLQYGIYGLYNFYKMQIVKQIQGKDLILLFTRWGRVGQIGQYQKTPFPNEESAIKEFKKIFRAKSGNNWDALNTFVPIPKKYRLINMERRKMKKGYMNKVKVNFAEIEQAMKNNPSNIKSGALINLIKKLCLVHKPKEVIKKQIDDDEDDDVEDDYQEGSGLPLGLLDKTTLEQGDQLLDQISKLLREKEKLNEKKGVNNNTNQSTDQYTSIYNSIIALSEQFFTLIPVQGFSFEKVEPIFDMDKLRKNQLQIHHFVHLEYATKLLLASQLKLQTMNPYDYIYKSLNTKLELMDGLSEESQLILQYIRNTGENDKNSPKIDALFRVERPGEMKRLEETAVGNRWLLWHGTKTKNLLNILNSGLQVVPLGASLSGHLFGKGIYFADMFQKSSHYCFHDGQYPDSTKFMFLCEVALGKTQEINLNDGKEYDALESGFNSFKTGNSQYEPNPGTTIYWNGRTVPLGKKTKHILEEKEKEEDEDQYYGLDFNEYVIFDKSQVCLRYLVQFRD